ncbi:MAG: hypothetical protein ACRYHQ_20785 [Janthinobacterium lividum]
MPTMMYRGRKVECSEGAARMMRAATTDAARKPAPIRYARVLDPVPNATHDALEAAERKATKDAVDAATARLAPGFYTTARREATNAALRQENAANRARWAAKA